MTKWVNANNRTELFAFTHLVNASALQPGFKGCNAAFKTRNGQHLHDITIFKIKDHLVSYHNNRYNIQNMPNPPHNHPELALAVVLSLYLSISLCSVSQVVSSLSMEQRRTSASSRWRTTAPPISPRKKPGPRSALTGTVTRTCVHNTYCCATDNAGSHGRSCHFITGAMFVESAPRNDQGLRLTRFLKIQS